MPAYRHYNMLINNNLMRTRNIASLPSDTPKKNKALPYLTMRILVTAASLPSACDAKTK